VAVEFAPEHTSPGSPTPAFTPFQSLRTIADTKLDGGCQLPYLPVVTTVRCSHLASFLPVWLVPSAATNGCSELCVTCHFLCIVLSGALTAHDWCIFDHNLAANPMHRQPSRNCACMRAIFLK
jgi:hypothetical protein